uniref:Integrase catalytic domain-containing protein n=1 Tax=Trichuris muris TaxID=70415 RepID=A0A5S6Q179_TRIMR
MNRIAEVLEESKPGQWRYVPSELNPADDLSRGLRRVSADISHRWFCGPKFLWQTEEHWPTSPVDRAHEMQAQTISVCAIGQRQNWENPLRDLFDKCSRWRSIIRIVAWALRAMRKRSLRPVGSLSVEELTKACETCLRMEQRTYFEPEISALEAGIPLSQNSRIAALRPFLDQSGLLRVGGRLREADVIAAVKHPIILACTGSLLHRIVWDRHLQLMHARVERILTDLRSEFWILSGRRAIRTILKGCLYCKKLAAKPCEPLMGDLPSCRVDHTLPAFANTGVDLFGPIEVNVLRSKVKRYGCLFTCMSSRACHLEVAYSLDVDSFINCLRRFIARRGCPLRIFSDNGKNLVAAERLLRQTVVAEERVDRFLTGQNIDWKFTPPYCPHYGGSWERLIGVAKRALVATLRGNAVSDEVLATVLAEVEALLNGRPLTYLSSDPECFEPLTPFHILIGRQNSNVPAVVAAGPATPRPAILNVGPGPPWGA